MIRKRIWLAFHVIIIALLRCINGDYVTTMNNDHSAITIDAELSEDTQSIKGDKKLKEEIKKAILDEELSVIVENDVVDGIKIFEGNKIPTAVDSGGNLFDELDEGHGTTRDFKDPLDDDEDGFPRTFLPKAVTTPGDVLKAMRSLEKFVGAAKKNYDINKVVTPTMKELFRTINIYVTRIVQLTLNPDDAHKFLENEGFTKCILPNMWIEYPELRTNLLRLIKQLMDVTSQTLKVIPIELLDPLLRVFENDDNLFHKTLVIDILCIWLPGHPNAQALVIQLSGLYPFYQHIPKLDSNVVYNMIALLNTLIKEHMEVRKNKDMYTKEERKLYQRTGLLDQISTRKICHGLLTIIQDALEYNTINNNILVPALELAKLVKPTCTPKYKGRKKPYKFFIRLQSYVAENRKYLGGFLSELEGVETALNEYIEELKPKHVEL